MNITETYITFGVGYPDPRTPGIDPEILHPQGMFGEGYATLQAPSRDAGRGIAYALFGGKFAFDYPERPRADYVPAGEVLRVVVLQRDQLEEMRRALVAADEAADGGSNDDEITALQGVRDLLRDVVLGGRMHA